MAIKFRRAIGYWLLWRVFDILPRNEAYKLYDTLNQAMTNR